MINIKKILIQTILSILCFLILSILIDKNIINKDVLFENKIINIIPYKLKIPFINEDIFVSNSKYNYTSIEQLDSFYKINFDDNIPITNLKNGTVVFVGKLKNYNNSVIIRSEGNVEFIYSNLDNISVNLYDYINKGEIIGNTLNNYLLLSINKDGKLISYEDFI